MNTKMLMVYASPRGENSLSHKLAYAFTQSLSEHGFSGEIHKRDLARTSLAFVDQAWIKAAFTPEEKRDPQDREALALSDELIAEIVEADLIVIATPMHNYGMPAPLKAWVDQVVRIGKTFSFDLKRGDMPLEPMLSGKHMLILSSRGEFGFQSGCRQSMNHLDPHLATIADFLGVDSKDVRSITIEYQEFKDERHDKSVAAALAASREEAWRWIEPAR